MESEMSEPEGNAEVVPVPFAETEVLAEFDLSRYARAHRARKPIDWRVVRSLTPADIPLLANPPRGDALVPRQTVIRHSHHMLAQCIAKGMDDTEASLISGYAPSYISFMRGDPAFQELLATYGAEREAVFVDVLERMKALGLHTLEELQARLEDQPDKFSNRELQELARMLLIESKQKDLGGGGGPGVAVAISFVQAPGGTRPGVVIEGREE
jgi:hypothetical protein